MNEGVVDGGLFVQSFAKGLDVLLAFDAGRTSMNLPELASAAGISKSAAQRFAFTLEALGYVTKDAESKRYSLTPRVLELGYRYLQVDRTLERANPYLLELNRQCGETVNISEPDGVDMIFVGRFPGRQTMPVYMPVGRRLPMFCTAAGRAYLAALPTDAAREILQRSDRRRYSPTTVTEIPELLELLAQSRERGYSLANGEYYQGDLGIGVPIFDRMGRPIASINVSGSSTRWTLDRLQEEIAPMLMETMRLICTTPPSPKDAEPFRVGLHPQTVPGRRNAARRKT
ncbi:IclR family transcriptional regulator [Variovorax sp. PBL-E5]|uniref:IclR family transcriptional regulator n=1 Tax=Variovorax sp. PBL-E5 TaxID=434014 RepID=UPI0013178128|nr:IclR family transcriptional regulator C-terminal domain-containing protein [Variovorax sp. PBL-E5]VTU45644.1 Pca regulon regulatory protein [Variovorax sp. PBL-E5]